MSRVGTDGSFQLYFILQINVPFVLFFALLTTHKHRVNEFESFSPGLLFAFALYVGVNIEVGWCSDFCDRHKSRIADLSELSTCSYQIICFYF